ncbi:hypothetical protein KIN20_036889 [Parelaphostrongylus tenuis]|uniref:Helicase ATP-binding domain-containing protein n=2 Tax=Parelaphostrongylus tenuis TaxID=148309 RepID=A0AAD5WKW8_PARTN|nr:hypothetical protein KIN20_036889 [Parelaphostrongylus tenuis]
MSQPDAKALTKTPDGFLYPLKEHQMAGLTWMTWRESLSPKGGILADEMGLGKTLLVIALIAAAKSERERRRIEGRDSEDKERRQIARQEGLTPSNATLIIAPAALIYHWENEVHQKCESGLLKVAVYHAKRKHISREVLARNDIVITTYTLIALECDKETKKGSLLVGIQWARIVLDEAHIIKNKKTKAAKLPKSRSRDQRLEQLDVKIEEFASCSDLGVFEEFRQYGEKKSVERLNLLMKTFVLRREKSSVSPITEAVLVELPAKHNHDHMLDFSDGERRAYDIMYDASRAVVREMITEDEVDLRFGSRRKKTVGVSSLPAKNVFIGTSGVTNPSTKFEKMAYMLVMLLRLRQACIHFHLTKNAVNAEAFQSIGTEQQLTAEQQEELANITIDSFVDSTNFDDLSFIFRRKYPSAKIDFALNLLGRILENNEKCVMVSQWTSFLKILEKHIVRRFPNAQCSTISGEVQPSERQDRVKRFNEEREGANVMLISISAGGVGLNLTGGERSRMPTFLTVSFSTKEMQ